MNPLQTSEGDGLEKFESKLYRSQPSIVSYSAVP